MSDLKDRVEKLEATTSAKAAGTLSRPARKMYLLDENGKGVYSLTVRNGQLQIAKVR